MATTLRAHRLIDAKRDVEKAETLTSKIAALRELLAVHAVGRIYRRFAEKKLIEFRAEAGAIGNDELLRRLDLLDQRLVLHVESEKSRLARKRGQRKQQSKEAPVVPHQREDLISLWENK